MEFFIDFLTTPLFDTVTQAIAWWIPMAASGAISIGSKLLGGGDKVNTDPARGQMSQTRGQFADVINQMISRGESRSNQPRLTAEDLFGADQQRLQDATLSQANATKQAISRSLMASGGDVSGSGGANLLGVDQQANQALGEQARQFSQLALGENRFQQQRGDQLQRTGLQGLQNLYGIDQSVLQDQLLQNQAARQRRNDIISTILNAGTTLSSSLA